METYKLTQVEYQELSNALTALTAIKTRIEVEIVTLNATPQEDYRLEFELTLNSALKDCNTAIQAVESFRSQYDYIPF